MNRSFVISLLGTSSLSSVHYTLDKVVLMYTQEDFLKAYPKTPAALQAIQAQAKWTKAL